MTNTETTIYQAAFELVQKRVNSVSWCLLVGFFFTLIHWTTLEAEMTVPKTLFVVMDGIPTDVIERVATPHLDQIIARGGFTRAYVGGEIGGASQSPTI